MLRGNGGHKIINLLLGKPKQCAASACKNMFTAGAYRIDVIGEHLSTKCDGGWVCEVFSFCSKLECLLNSKRSSNKKMPQHLKDSLKYTYHASSLHATNTKNRSSLKSD